jgi:hypothetical protein
MTTLDDLFAKPRQYDHPKLRSWLSYRSSPDTRTSHLEFQREREGLMFKPARLYFTVEWKNVARLMVDSEPWDDAFNDGLLEHKFRARDAENESERFGYMLVGKMQPLVNRFNDGFFNAVLVRYLNDNGYSRIPQVAAQLAKISTDSPHQGDSLVDCQQRLDSVLSWCAEQLVRLDYTAGEGISILSAALAYYLDERFSLTSRELLGW